MIEGHVLIKNLKQNALLYLSCSVSKHYRWHSPATSSKRKSHQPTIVKIFFKKSFLFGLIKSIIFNYASEKRRWELLYYFNYFCYFIVQLSFKVQLVVLLLYLDSPCCLTDVKKIRPTILTFNWQQELEQLLE